MNLGYVILAAIAPVCVLLCYIYYKDKAHPEPRGWLLKGFFYGILSIFVSLSISTPIGALMGFPSDTPSFASISDAVGYAFCMAAIPEEVAKLLMLWLLLRKNPYFDEHFDGIVYAVCIGMGFAGLENVMYLLDGVEDGSWIGTGIMRALFAVPGHFLFAVLMGYYYSLVHFRISRSIFARIMVLLAPILAHGIYDGILMSREISEVYSVMGMIVFLIFFDAIRRKGKKRIQNLVGK